MILGLGQQITERGGSLAFARITHNPRDGRNIRPEHLSFQYRVTDLDTP
jgi:hypothetical protein